MYEFHMNHCSHRDERMFNLEGGLKSADNAAKNNVDKYRIKAEIFTFLLILSVFTNISYTLVILNVIYANRNTFPLHLQENGRSKASQKIRDYSCPSDIF